MLELDEVVRQNQRACLPFAKSGKAEADLHEQYPELTEMTERARRAIVDSMALHSRLHEDELRFSGSLKSRAAFPDDLSQSPSAQKSRRRSSKAQSPRLSPLLKPRSSVADLMFEMDEGEESDTEKTRPATTFHEGHGTARYDQLPGPSLGLPAEEPWIDSKGLAMPTSANHSMAASPNPWPKSHDDDVAHSPRAITPSENTKPWGSSALASSKLDMKEIMAQASSNRVSNISAGLSLRAQRTDIGPGSLPGKMSQRERKKQQQAQQHQLASPTPLAEKRVQDETPSSPWQVATRSPKISLKDVLGAESKSPVSLTPSGSRTSSIPPLTLRQTVSGNTSAAHTAVSSSSKPQSPPQHRSVSSPSVPPSTFSSKPNLSRSTSLTPHPPPHQ